MEEEGFYKRTTREVMEDIRWGDFAEELGSSSDKRHKALTKVMRMISEDDYRKLVVKISAINLLIEPANNLGKVHPFAPASTLMVYLSPILEGLEIGMVSVVIAHELAHIILDHKPESPGSPEYQHQEDKAWDLASEWGFQKDVENHLELKKRGEIIKIRLEPSIKG